MIFRLFRAPELAVWTLVVIGLGVLTYFALTMGSSGATSPQVDSGNVISVKAAQDSDAAGYVRDLQTLMPHGVAAGKDTEALSTWGQLVQQYSDSGSELRASEGAGTDDGLLGLFTTISQLAEQLQAVDGDFVQAGSLRTQIGLAVDQAVSLISGFPVPGMNDGHSSDPLGIKDAEPTQPSPTPPNSPNAPTVPGSGQQPQPGNDGRLPSPPDLSTIFKEN